ncbi:MAG: winged helix-turn-helix domain-containing protein [Eubacterium sp.]|nr:winged helix-turn-helix domain-containing protein [Eubacterium sp.]
MYIKTFGNFQLTDGDVTFDQSDINSIMMMKLLLFLALHKNETIPKEEIASSIWNDDDTDNPMAALRNMIYRLRSFLTTHFGERDYLISGRGFCKWNPEVEITTDIDRFHEIIEKCQSEDVKEDELISLYKEAIDLYTGDMLPWISDMSTLRNTSILCHDNYVDAVEALAQIYNARGDYKAMELLAGKALKTDRTNDDFHALLVRAYAKQGMRKEAMNHYKEASEALEREFGIRASDSLQRAFEDITRMDSEDAIQNLENICEAMSESDPEGAFFCEYPVFRSIFKLESRRIKRLNLPEYLLLLSIENKSRADDTPAAELEKAIISTLRTGDIATRCSSSQYMVLLPGCDFESACMVAERMLEAYTLEDAKINIKLEDLNTGFSESA